MYLPPNFNIQQLPVSAHQPAQVVQGFRREYRGTMYFDQFQYNNAVMNPYNLPPNPAQRRYENFPALPRTNGFNQIDEHELIPYLPSLETILHCSPTFYDSKGIGGYANSPVVAHIWDLDFWGSPFNKKELSKKAETLSKMFSTHRTKEFLWNGYLLQKFQVIMNTLMIKEHYFHYLRFLGPIEKLEDFSLWNENSLNSLKMAEYLASKPYNKMFIKPLAVKKASKTNASKIRALKSKASKVKELDRMLPFLKGIEDLI